MKTSDISDAEVLRACLSYHDDLSRGLGQGAAGTGLKRLTAMTGAPEKVARRAMERAYDRELLEVGMGIDWAWPTAKGLASLPEEVTENSPYAAHARALQAYLDQKNPPAA